jgi:hypothetical protein
MNRALAYHADTKIIACQLTSALGAEVSTCSKTFVNPMILTYMRNVATRPVTHSNRDRGGAHYDQGQVSENPVDRELQLQISAIEGTVEVLTPWPCAKP